MSKKEKKKEKTTGNFFLLQNMRNWNPENATTTNKIIEKNRSKGREALGISKLINKTLESCIKAENCLFKRALNP